MAGLFAAQIVAVLAHMFEHIAVAHGGAGHFEADGGEVAFEAKVGHDRGHDARPGQAAVLFPALGHHGHELVAVHQMAALVHQQHPVRVAIKGDADVRPHLPHLGGERLRGGGAHVLIDVEAIGLHADGEDLRAQFPQGRRRYFVGRAIGAIDDDAQAFQREVAGQGALGEFDIAGIDALHPLGPTEIARLREARTEISGEQGLDLALDLVGELVAIGAEELDAVVLELVVGGGDHDAEIGAHGGGQHGHRRRRHRAEQQHIHAHGGEARDHGGLDHVAAEAGVLADDDPMAVIAALERQTGRLANLEREFRGDEPIGPSANAICAEEFFRH